MRRPKKKVLLVAALIVISSALLLHHVHYTTTLPYWQQRAAKVRLGMTRVEAEKLLPPQAPYDPSLLLRLEYWRDVHAPHLPRIAKTLYFGCACWKKKNRTWQVYEVSESVFTGIGYDMAGSKPPHVAIRPGIFQPQDRVIVLPMVTTTQPELSGHPVDFFH